MYVKYYFSNIVNILTEYIGKQIVNIFVNLYTKYLRNKKKSSFRFTLKNILKKNFI
jgi:hypothetical protein